MVDGRMDRRTDIHTYLPTSSVPFSLFQLHCLLDSLQKHLAPSHYPRALALAAFSASIPAPTHSLFPQFLLKCHLCRLHSRSGIHASFLLLPHRTLHSIGTFTCPPSTPLEGSTKAGILPTYPAAVPLTLCPWQVLIIFVKFKNGWGLGYTAEMAQWLRKPFVLAEDLSSSPSTHTGLQL